jgi:hypothetical protein
VELFRRPLTAAKVWCWIALAVVLLPLALPPYSLPFGFNFFFGWVALCAASVLADRPVAWLLLSATPLALASWDWLQGPRDDEFGFYPWAPIALFSGIALTIGATGVLLVLRVTMRSGLNGS